MSITYPIVPPEENDLVSPAWAGYITEAANTHEARVTTLEASTVTYVVKAANETVSASTTQQDDNHLFTTVAANARYECETFIITDGTAAGDVSIRFTMPSGAVISLAGIGPQNALTTWEGDGNFIAKINESSPTSVYVYGINATNKVGVWLRGILDTSSTAGTLAVQWAQFAASGTTTVYEDSFLKITRIS